MIRPGTRIKSEIPCIAWRSTSSAIENASISDVRRSMIASSRSLGIVMTVSTHFSQRLEAGLGMGRSPLPASNLNGLVTTATVSAPSSLARLAITGRGARARCRHPDRS